MYNVAAGVPLGARCKHHELTVLSIEGGNFVYRYLPFLCIALGMSVKRVEEYRRKAQECVAHAQRATDLGDKATWLNMAENWQTLAEKASGGPTIQVPPAIILERSSKKV